MVKIRELFSEIIMNFKEFIIISTILRKQFSNFHHYYYFRKQFSNFHHYYYFRKQFSIFSAILLFQKIVFEINITIIKNIIIYIIFRTIISNIIIYTTFRNLLKFEQQLFYKIVQRPIERQGGLITLYPRYMIIGSPQAPIF